jgi:phosphatidylserine decarboxylase
VSDRLKVIPQYVLPKRLLTQALGSLARHPGGAVTHTVIRRFIARYGVNLAEAAQPDVTAYATFNDFFTRALRDGVRPLADADMVCPVDGAISQLGPIDGDQIFQAKGHTYSTKALVGGDAALAQQFQGGNFATIYLSPRDYHRIHMPLAGRLLRMIHVPGELFSVNPTTARGVPGLFARNERVVCVFESDIAGRKVIWVNVLVGATIVGSMATVWHGVINPPRPGIMRQWEYGLDSPSGEVTLDRGAEMGRFLLGSTVVLLFPRKFVELNPAWQAGTPVRMGEAMGRFS